VGQERRERADVVLHDHVWLGLLEDVLQPGLAVLRAVDQRCEDRRDERLELLDRRLPELGRRLGDEVGPELAGALVAFGWWGEIDEVFLEAEGLEPTLP
jgi:hypothetical protein